MIVLLLALHFIADFLLQSREMGQKKSSEFKWLVRHLLRQWVVFASGLMFFAEPATACIFATLNTLIHGIIDWYIWKGYKYTVGVWMKNNPDHETTKLYLETGVFKYWEDKVFYDTIGFDQFLHGSTLAILAWWLL